MTEGAHAPQGSSPTPREGEPFPVEALSADTIDAVVAALGPLLTAPRQARMAAALATRTRDVVLVLEDLANEHNGAAVLRTAEALGVLEVHVVEPELGRFRVAQRISKGTQKWLDVRHVPSIHDTYRALRARGVAIYASTLRGQAVDVAELPTDRPVAVVFGNELRGVSDAAIDGADGTFRIPMVGFVESLNISVAAAITLYDQTRRRRARPLAPDDARRVEAAWLARSVRSAGHILGRHGLPVPVLGATEWLDALEAEERARFAPGGADAPLDEPIGP